MAIPRGSIFSDTFPMIFDPSFCHRKKSSCHFPLIHMGLKCLRDFLDDKNELVSKMRKQFMLKLKNTDSINSEAKRFEYFPSLPKYFSIYDKITLENSFCRRRITFNNLFYAKKHTSH